MNALKLTNGACAAHKAPMSGTRRACVGMMAMLGCGLAGGCISVTAPDKPIVIELNINIKQEVVYRLAAGAQNAIEENKDIF
jgi:hypothetical protein